MATTTNLDSLVINYLTQAQYDEAAQAGTLNANQLYLTPDTGGPTGTLSSVGVSNATNGGLTVSGSPLTSDGTITIGHSNVLSSAQTTQAVYPIKIDKNGHISEYGSAVTISDTKVTQNYSTASGGHPILMTPEANISSTSSRGDTTAILTNAIYATPSTGNLQATTFNGYTLAAASAKAVDTSISAASTSTNLPTSAAVASFVEGKGYITSADVPEGASAYTGTISAVGTTASNGTNNGFARGDHVHNITKTTVDTVLGTGSGTAKFYREDGTWATPAYTTNTDEKLKLAALSTSGTYYMVLSGASTTAETKYYDERIAFGRTDASDVNIAIGKNGSTKGSIRLYTTTSGKYGIITPGTLSTTQTYTLPNKTGTVALTSDIPSVPTSAASSTTGITASTTANKTTVGSSSTDYGVTAAGSGSFTSGTFSGGSGSFAATVTSHVLSFSHTHTAATHGADSHTHTAPTLGSKVPTVSTASATVSITDPGHTHTLS